MSWRKVAEGSFVLSCLLILDSADVLSELVGIEICICFPREVLGGHNQKSQLAKNLKAWNVLLCIFGQQRFPNSKFLHGKQFTEPSNVFEKNVMIQPPIPKELPSANASAAARRVHGEGWASGYTWVCLWRISRNHWSFLMVSRVNDRWAWCGTAMRTHWSFEVFGVIGTSLFCLAPSNVPRPQPDLEEEDKSEDAASRCWLKSLGCEQRLAKRRRGLKTNVAGGEYRFLYKTAKWGRKCLAIAGEPNQDSQQLFHLLEWHWVCGDHRLQQGT